MLKMRTAQIKVSETDYQKYNFNKGEVKFNDLVELINQEYAKNALQQCNDIAKQVGLSALSLDEINAEIKAVRNAKNNS